MSEPGQALKVDRERCYIARDSFFTCSDRYLDEGLTEEQATQKCRSEKRLFDKDCPTSWVGHFLRKHNFERYKKKLSDEGLNVAEKENGFSSLLSCRFVVNTDVGNKQSIPKLNKWRKTNKYESLQQQQVDFKKKFPQVQIETISQTYKELQENFNTLPPQVTPNASYGYRNFSALRRCQRYNELRDCIRNNLDVFWTPPTVIEALRGLVEAKIYSKEVEEDRELGLRLTKCCKGSLPAPVEYSINLLSGLLNGYDSMSLSDKRLNIIYVKEIERLCALVFLVDGRWDIFKKFTENRNIDLTEPIFLFWLWKTIERKKVRGDECVRHLLDKCMKEERLLCADNFASYFGPFLSKLCDLTRPRISKNGLVENRYQILSKTFPSDHITHLHKDLLCTLEDLSRKGGSLVKDELTSLVASVSNWKSNAIKRDGKLKALVVDSLNLTPTNENNSFQNLIKRVAKEYGNCFFVIRRHLLHLVPKNTPGNVKFFVCNANAEDDLFVLYAALTWGLDAEILSNDNFEAHVTRVRITGPLTLRDWIKQCVIKFERGPRSYVFANDIKSRKAVEKLDEDVYLLPSQSKTDKPEYLNSDSLSSDSLFQSMNEVNNDTCDEPNDTLFNENSSTCSQSEFDEMSIIVGSMNTFSEDPSHTRLTFFQNAKPSVRLDSWDACIEEFCAESFSRFAFTRRVRNESELCSTSYLPSWNEDDVNINDIFQPTTSTNQWESNMHGSSEPEPLLFSSTDRLSTVLRCGTADGRVHRKDWVYLYKEEDLSTSDRSSLEDVKEFPLSPSVLSTLYENDTCNVNNTGNRASCACDINILYNNRVCKAPVGFEATELANREDSKSEVICKSQLDCDNCGQLFPLEGVSKIEKLEETEEVKDLKKIDEIEKVERIEEFKDADETKEVVEVNPSVEAGETDKNKEDRPAGDEDQYYDDDDEEDDEDYVKEEIEEDDDDEYRDYALEEGEERELLLDKEDFELELLRKELGLDFQPEPIKEEPIEDEVEVTPFLYEPDEYNDVDFGAEPTVIPVYKEDELDNAELELDDPISYDTYLAYVKRDTSGDIEESERASEMFEQTNELYSKRRDDDDSEDSQSEEKELDYLKSEGAQAYYSKYVEHSSVYPKQDEKEEEDYDWKDKEGQDYVLGDELNEAPDEDSNLDQLHNEDQDLDSDESENVDYRCKSYHSRNYKEDDSDSDETASSEDYEDEDVDVGAYDANSFETKQYERYDQEEYQLDNEDHLQVFSNTDIDSQGTYLYNGLVEDYNAVNDIDIENVDMNVGSPEINVCEPFDYIPRENEDYRGYEGVQYTVFQPEECEELEPFRYQEQHSERQHDVTIENQYKKYGSEYEEYPSDEFKGYEPVEVGEYESEAIDVLYPEFEEYGPSDSEQNQAMEFEDNILNAQKSIELQQFSLEQSHNGSSSVSDINVVEKSTRNSTGSGEHCDINLRSCDLAYPYNSTDYEAPSFTVEAITCETLPCTSTEFNPSSRLIDCDDEVCNAPSINDRSEHQRVESMNPEKTMSSGSCINICYSDVTAEFSADNNERNILESTSGSYDFSDSSNREMRINGKYPVDSKPSGSKGYSDGNHSAAGETRRDCDALHNLPSSSGRKRRNCVLHCCSDWKPSSTSKATSRAEKQALKKKMNVTVGDRDSSGNTKKFMRASYGSDDEDYSGEVYSTTENADIVVDLEDPDTDTEEPTVEFNDESKETRHLLRTYTAPDRVPGSGISRSSNTRKPEYKQSVEAMVIESLKESREKFNNKTSKVDFSRSSKQASVYGYH
ncbi:unnamed protein product [Auanema sp. JU1783]|nr:unnamed protein product [Auanema sp. JU1783]